MTRERTVALAAILAVAIAISAPAQQPSADPQAQAPPGGGGVGLGDLLVAPTRVVFEGRNRSAEITLVNIGDARATYRVSFIHLRMDEEGKLTEIEEPGPGEAFADDLVRHSPRQVTLEPRQSQTIRLQVRKPADLPAGEYRSHMLLRAIPDAEEMQSSVETKQSEGISIRLIPIYGVSIPVIVREGETHATASISDIIFHAAGDGAPARILFRVSRGGNASLYGVFKVSWIPRRGKEEIVAMSGGYSVYVPNAFRNVEMSLSTQPGVELRDGTLRVTYLDGDVNGEAIAEAETRLP